MVQALERARDHGIGALLQGGVSPQDWQTQKMKCQKFSGQGLPEIWPCFGLHPYFVADHSQEECETALDQLSLEISQAFALGETGLDFRPHILKDSRDRQLDMFHQQLELAKFANKAVVLHVVQAFDEALRMVEIVEDLRGFVHGFNGSAAKARQWCALGFGLSIGDRVLRDDNQRLHQAVLQIPADFLLVESDDQEPISIIAVAEKIALIRGVTKEEILDKSQANLRRILHEPGRSPKPNP